MRSIGRLGQSLHAPRPRPRRWGRALAFGVTALAATGLLAAGGPPTRPWTLDEPALPWPAGLRVERVEVVGTVRTAAADLEPLVAELRGQNILAVDPYAVQNRFEELAWVEQAKVRRLLPNTLVVELREYRPGAVWRSSEGLRLVAASGKTIPAADLRPFRRLPVLYGQGAPRAFPELVALFAEAPELASRLSAAVRVGDRRWDLYFDGRLRVRLPERGLENAWRRFVEAVRDRKLLERSVRDVDLRHPGWLVVRPETAAGERT